MTEELQLLQNFAQTGSQKAFAELVRRYVDVVYSAARRQVRNDAHAAEDITQAVFLLLARKARSIPADRPLSAWLLRVTVYCAANARRKQDRQKLYERRSAMAADTSKRLVRAGDDPDWELLSPLLDQGISKLPAADRDAVLLRFIEKKSLRQIAESLNISEEAAQKRVSRAVDKLRDFFQRKGVVTMSAAGLATLLATKSVLAAPAELATSVASAGGASAAAGTGAAIAKGALIIMATEKIKVAVIAAILLILGIGGSIAFVKAFSAPSRRTIQVAGATPRAVAPPLPPSKWPLKFSDGTTMELLALNDPNADPAVWWTPDGTPTPDPQFRARGGITMNYATGRRIDLIVRLTGSALTSKGMNVRSDISGDDDTAMLWSSGMPGRIAKVITVVADQQATTTLKFGLATGPWTGELNLPCGDGANPPFGSTGAGVKFRAITEDKGQTIVHYNVLDGAGKEDSRLVVVVGGKEITPISNWSNLIEDTYTFDTPRSKVTRIIARSRPYEWIELKNLALEPTTTPTAVAARPTTMP